MPTKIEAGKQCNLENLLVSFPTSIKLDPRPDELRGSDFILRASGAKAPILPAPDVAAEAATFQSL
jgi:hypothetical protein